MITYLLYLLFVFFVARSAFAGTDSGIGHDFDMEQEEELDY